MFAEGSIFGFLENQPLEVQLPEADSIEDLAEWIKVGVPTMVNSINSKAKVVTRITHYDKAEGVSSVTISDYDMAPLEHFGGELYAALFRPAGNPAPADEITILVPAKTIQDIYGNVNDAFELGPFKYAYNPVYPQTGVYYVQYEDGPFAIQLVAMDDADPTAGYALYADWFGLFGGKSGNPILYFTVDEPSRTLTCDDQLIWNGALDDGAFGSGYYYYDAEHTQMLVFWGSGDYGDEPIVINYDDNGILTSTSDFEYAVHNVASGNYLGPVGYCKPGTAIVPASSSDAKAKISASRSTRMAECKDARRHFSK